VTSPSAHTLFPFWSDDFDMDLLKVLPEAPEILGRTQAITLYTYCSHPTHGRINAPDAWHSDRGLTSFFGFTDAAKPASYHTSGELLPCTFLEAVRDEWCHGSVMRVEREIVWQPASLRESFDVLMSHLRGWHRVTELERELHLGRVRWSLHKAADRLARIAVKAGVLA
jgi:hypothetical protein